MIQHHCELATEFAQWIERHPLLELFDHQLNLITFAHVEGNESSELLLRRINENRRVFVTQARVGERFILRVCVGQRATSRKHIDTLLGEIESGLVRRPS